MLADKFPNALVIGLDFDEKMIEYAKQRKISNAFFFVQNLEEPFESWPNELKNHQDCVDVIFSNYSLHWIDDFEILSRNIGLLLRKNSGYFVGNLLYCGWLQDVADPEEKNLLDKYLDYPSEADFVSRFVFAMKKNCQSNWMNIEYQEPISRYDKEYYSKSFIKLPLDWYKKFLRNQTKNFATNQIEDLERIIVRLILKQRIINEIPEDFNNNLIDIKQQLWIIQIKRNS
uniref:Methyltransferase domain-containing protein n=1 Tax=Sarcoptes scabiei TaxID=52283 RepID=A0A834RGV6_SARSC